MGVSCSSFMLPQSRRSLAQSRAIRGRDEEMRGMHIFDCRVMWKKQFSNSYIEFPMKAWFKHTQFCMSSITFSVQVMIKKNVEPKCNAQVLAQM